MLDHHSSGIARIVERGEEDEQPVVTIFPRAAPAIGKIQTDDLGGAGLARHQDIVDRQARAARRARAIDRVGHRLADIADMLVGKIDRVEALDRGPAVEPRFDMAPRREAGRHDRQLERIGEHVALADGRVDGVVGLPLLVVFLELPGRIGNGAVELADHRQLELLAHAASPRHGRDRIHADALRHGVEIDIAGLIDAHRHIDRAVPAAFPAAKHPVAHPQPARALNPLVRIHACLQQCHRDHRLDRGGGGVETLEHLVAQGDALVLA